VLSLVKGVYPGPETMEIKKLLGKLARETNRLRDLDVYLLSRSSYTELLPKPLQGALGEMFLEFESERAGQMRKVAVRLNSASHRHCAKQLEKFFATDTFHEPTEHAETPIQQLVFERIYKRYRKIRRIALSLDADAGDEAVHVIRIECKKLRYLLEFFAEIIPPGSLETKEKQLRQLQNKLGAFNDCSVQQASLMEYWHKKRSDSGDQSALALSLGGLISILHDHHRTHREKVFGALEEFSSESTAALFKKTFKLPKSRRSSPPALSNENG
jgi:CHAD domain-containing protein